MLQSHSNPCLAVCAEVEKERNLNDRHKSPILPVVKREVLGGEAGRRSGQIREIPQIGEHPAREE